MPKLKAVDLLCGVFTMYLTSLHKILDHCFMETSQVDRIYLQVPNILQIEEPSIKKTILVTKSESWFDAVIWNPWIQKAKKMKDLPDSDYEKFVCLEVARTSPHPITIQPKANFKATVEFQIMEL